MRLPVLLLTMVLAACGRPTKHNYAQIEKLAWLEGRWRIEGKDSAGRGPQLDTRWLRPNDSTLNLRTYQRAYGDSFLLSSIYLTETGGRLHYEATSTGPKGMQAERFLRSDSGESVYTFIKTMNDFPARVRYQPIDRNDVLVTVNDAGSTDSVHLKRLN